MPFQFDFDFGNKILRCRFTGRVSDDELKEYYVAARRYTTQSDAHGAFTDFSEAISVDVSPQTVRALAGLPPAMPDVSRLRCVVAPTDKVLGLARMFELHGEETRVNLHVVRTVKEALAILGVLEPTFEPFKLE